MSTKDSNPETIEMDMKEEMSSTGSDSGEEFTRETKPTFDVDETEIKHEEMDFHPQYNSTADAHSEDHSDLNLETMSSTKVEEKETDFYHDLLLCDRDCGTCIKYMRMLIEHVRITHAPNQPIQDPLLIDPVSVTLTYQSSSSIQIKSEVDENSVKMELDCSDLENTSGDEFIREGETTLIVDKIEIKHEEMDFHLHHNATSQAFSEVHSYLSHKTMSSICNVECESIKADEKDLKDFYVDPLLCERDCDTCVKYMKILSEHVRVSHAPPQPIQDPLLIDPVPLTEESSSSTQIKSQVDEIIVKIEFDCSDHDDVSTQNSDTDPDYNIKPHSESDPDYAPSPSFILPSPSFTQELRRESQGLARTHAPSQSRISKSKKKILPSRKHFKCTECAKSFKRRSYLCRHMRVHTGEKPFKCDVCEMSFARSYHLTEHRRIHTGERPFQCNLCEKSFARSTHLTEHKRIHTGEKPFKCDVCDKSFSQCNALTKHKTVHTEEKPFKCNVCEKSFTLKGSLTTHTRIHTGEKCFQCDICVKSFTQKSNLIAHKRNHTGERPYECDQCDKSFTTQGSLTDHKKIHT